MVGTSKYLRARQVKLEMQLEGRGGSVPYTVVGSTLVSLLYLLILYYFATFHVTTFYLTTFYYTTCSILTTHY